MEKGFWGMEKVLGGVERGSRPTPTRMQAYEHNAQRRTSSQEPAHRTLPLFAFRDAKSLQ